VDEPRSAHDPWKRASWAGAETTILEAGARLSLEDRLRWLEQAAAAARELRGAGTASKAGRSASTGSTAHLESSEGARSTVAD
jgi:hypothetical protein